MPTRHRDFRVGFGAAAVMLVCCASHVLALGTLGAVVAGSAFGLLASLVVAAAVLSAFFVLRRRRAACRPTSGANEGRGDNDC